MSDALDRLTRILREMRTVAVAVSGGIDSLTLATVAGRVLGPGATMHHATSPAVPPAATARTRARSAAEGWVLDVFDAGEFADPDYRANPVNRCFFCKQNLYGAVARRTDRQIVSGTNTDDLGDFRPGLEAARLHAARHPMVEAGIDKRDVRALAAELGLGGLAELPSAPCLSSRVETGIFIQPAVLSMIDAAEVMLRDALHAATVRCRVRADGLVIELDEAALQALDASRERALADAVRALADDAGLRATVRFAPYRTGSAFLRELA